MGREVEVEAVRTGGRNGDRVRNVLRLSCVDNDDLGRVGDVDVEGFRVGIEHRPACPPRHLDLGCHGPGVEIDD